MYNNKDESTTSIQEIIQELSPEELSAFCHHTFQHFPASYVHDHPELLTTDFDWINHDLLNAFLEGNSWDDAVVDLPVQNRPNPVHIKLETEDPDLSDPFLPLELAPAPQTRLIHENDHEYMLILYSDNELDASEDAVLGNGPLSSQDGNFDWEEGYEPDQNHDNHCFSDSARSSPTAVASDGDDIKIVDEYLDLGSANALVEQPDDDNIQSVHSSDKSEMGSIASVDEEEQGPPAEQQWVCSDTVWLDEGIYSEVLTPCRRVEITARQCKVQRVEWIRGGFPSYYPIPCELTAYIVDVSGLEYADCEGEIDKLIAGHEQESWHRATGKGNNKPSLSIFTGQKIKARCHRQYCAGVTACERVDPMLIPADRYKLDPNNFYNLIEKQINARVQQASTAERKTIIFFQVVNSSFASEIRFFENTQTYNTQRGGYNVWVGCLGVMSTFWEGHRSHTLPQGLVESILRDLFQNKPVAGLSFMETCSRIVPSRVGLRASAASTPLVLGGKSVVEVHPGLMNRRMKQKVIDQEKTKMFPKGRGFEGVVALYDEDRRRPIGERYIHGIEIFDDTKLIYTFHPPTLAIIHQVNQFEADGTFKRVEGEFDEYELTSRVDSVESGRIYFNTKTRETYKAIFDGLQRHVKSITGRPLSFHALQKGGNIRAVGTDMELAELLGMGDSFAALNDPEHSGVRAEDARAETITPLISRVCKTHYDRGALTLRKKVTPKEYNTIQNLPHAESEDALTEFTKWVTAKKDNDITNWWKHKQHPILAGLFRSRTKMSPESWALTNSTTNINEGMHSVTNRSTGTKKSLVEALLSGRQYDRTEGTRVLQSLKTGILKNPSNSVFDRMARNASRQATAMQKKTDAAHQNNEVARLNQEIAERKQALADLRPPRKPRRPAKEETSSSGRVSSSTPSARASTSTPSGRAPTSSGVRSARQSAAPYIVPALNASQQDQSAPVPNPTDLSATDQQWPPAMTNVGMQSYFATTPVQHWPDMSGQMVYSGLEPLSGFFANFPAQFPDSTPMSIDSMLDDLGNTNGFGNMGSSYDPWHQ
ncbi:hypothetical protein PQX77_022271 [Marasmius sp. AFHP31]|nr:hypothetical protein PQX77_022271 [Marasmius sp. AFHP31]